MINNYKSREWKSTSRSARYGRIAYCEQLDYLKLIDHFPPLPIRKIVVFTTWWKSLKRLTRRKKACELCMEAHKFMSLLTLLFRMASHWRDFIRARFPWLSRKKYNIHQGFFSASFTFLICSLG